MLENKKHPPFIDEEEKEDQVRLEASLVAEARLTEILTTISENKSDRVCTVGRLRNDVDKVFSSHLRNVIMGNSDPHYKAIEMQESLWELYGGYTVEILRLKCIMIGYNPNIFVDGKDPEYERIQL